MNVMPPAEVMVETPKRRGWKWLRIMGGLLVLVFGAGVAYYYYTLVASERDLRSTIARIDQLDPDWTLSQIAARQPAIPDEQNAILHVMTARQFLPLLWTFPPLLEELEEIESLPPPEQLGQEQSERIAAELKRAASLLAAARPIADMPRGRHDTGLSTDVVTTVLPHVDALTTLIAYMQLDVARRAQANDPEGAFTSVRIMFNGARALGDEAFAVTQLTRMSRASDALRAAQRVLAQGQVSEATLAALQKMIEEEEAYPGFLVAARGERAILHVMLERLETGEINNVRMRKMMGSLQQQAWQGTGIDRVDNILLGWPLSKLRDNHAAMLEFMSELVEVARLPLEEQQDAMERLSAKHEKLPTLARDLTAFRTRLAECNLRVRAELRCAAAAVAAERFRLHHGRWPDSLAELVPAFLQRIPTDPYARAPLRFQKTEQGLVIYALGPDLQDDGGKIFPKKMSWGGLVKGFDLGFRLWDVKNRRQPSSKAATGQNKPLS
jgi:hypothetical protein